MTNRNKNGFSGMVCAVALFAANSALAEGFEQRTATAIVLPAPGGTFSTLLSQALPAGTWIATAKASVVNFGDVDYARCLLIVDATTVDGSTSMIGEAGGAPAVATLVSQKLFRLTSPGLVSFVCLHDFPIDGEYVDPGASLIVTAAPPALPAGTMIRSDTNPTLAVKPDGGAQHGSILKLASNCTPANPDCTWSYRNGMIVSDANPTMAVSAGGAQHGTTLKLVNNCTSTKAECTWAYRNGVFLSDAKPSLAINAFGGAQHGTTLKLVNNCAAAIPDCTWTNRN